MKTLSVVTSLAVCMSITNFAQASVPSLDLNLVIADEDGSTNAQSHDFTALPAGVNPISTFNSTTSNPAVYDISAATSWHSNDGALFTINSAAYNKDPSLAFDVTATNNSNITKSYSFFFNAPMDPALIGTITSHADMSATLTDLTGTHGATTVKPLGLAVNMLNSYDYTVDGDAISKNVDIGTAFTFTTLSGSQTNNYSKDSSLVCDVACDTMTAVLTFTLSKGSSVNFVGNVIETSPVPVPGAVWFFGSTMAGLIGLNRRKLMLQAA